MTGEKVVLFGGPLDGAVIDQHYPGHTWVHQGLELRADGSREWVRHRYCARTGNYLGTKP